MKKITNCLFCILLATSISVPAFSQTKTNTDILQRASVQQAEKEKLLYKQLFTLSQQKGWPMVMKGKNGRVAILTGIDESGYPLYTTTFNNITAAATIRTNTLWPGGSTGLNLSGSSANVKDKLAIWDGGKVRSTHVELTGRVVQRDAPTSISDHSTHVAGTMIASGVNPLAKGMSFGEQELVAYDFNNDGSEMLNEAPNLLVSNHSYGEVCGWNFNDAQNRWEFWGQAGAIEDYKFGYYSSKAQLLDSIAYNAPKYLIVFAGGNNRGENGPAVGQPYWRFDASGTMVNSGNRPAGISNNDSYDIMPPSATAKNILTVGAVSPISSGYNKPGDAVLADFSSWGPADDGRIKPDVVTDGIDILSSSGTADNDYVTFSGTSMSAASASGSVFLLQEYYAQLHAGAFMRSATLKGIIIHTADEAGATPGPDYQYGWGLINMQKAAAVITSNNTDQLIQENVLNNGATSTQNITASGKGPLVATISWTDPKASVEPVATALNNPAAKLVDDLDIVIKKGATTYRPWILDPVNRTAPATTGDNTIDNVEKIVVTDVVPGDTYTIQVTHKGTLQRGSQAYSLIVSGVGSQAYCASNPTSNSGARIDSVSFTTLHNKNVAGCTTYSNFTNLIADIQPNQTTPLYIKLNSCDATAVDKIVKVYIDYNNDGDFNDAGENVAQSGVINGDGVFTANITTPNGLTQDYYSVLRIVMEETSVAANVTPCGTYTRGETQDYRVHFAAPTNDVGVSELVSPFPGDCSSGSQYAAIRIHNYGSVVKTNVPVSIVVKQGTTIVATISGAFPGTLGVDSTVLYTFQTPFILAASTTYTITSSTSLSGDQNTANDQVIVTVTTGANSPNPTGDAEICGTSNVFLHANTTTISDLFTWYNLPAATVAIASGANTSSTIITSNSTYYLANHDNSQTLGPANKLFFTDGGYNTFVGNIVKFTATVPATLQTARLYIGTPGKITFTLREVVTVNTDGSYTYFPISTTTIDVSATVPTPPVLGASDNDPADLGAVYYLGINFPDAADYFLIIECDNGASIFRNNNITTNPYPFTLPGVISITGNNATLATDPNYFQKFYYFFYNAAIKTSSCPSARVAVVATTALAPVITQAGAVLSSSFATGNQWYLDGNPISGAVSQNYTATSSGLYKVVHNDSYGCSLTSNEINFSVTALPNLDASEIALVVSPNPTSGQFHLQLETRTKADLSISLINTVGQKVYYQSIPGFIGKLSTEINPGMLSSGIYYLKIEHHNKSYLRKLVISK
jgi:Subtilase family/GEVED domain/Secretion system C-terminal sorting domain